MIQPTYIINFSHATRLTRTIPTAYTCIYDNVANTIWVFTNSLIVIATSKNQKKPETSMDLRLFFYLKYCTIFFIFMSLINRLISANQIFKIRLTTLSINVLAAPYRTDHKFHPYIYLVLRIQ